MQVYIPNLEVSDFIAYDGFTLINAKYLHTSNQIYLESPHHFLALRAYLYSWFATSMPLLHYIHEYILHGSIGYVMYLYTQLVFSEDEAVY